LSILVATLLAIYGLSVLSLCFNVWKTARLLRSPQSSVAASQSKGPLPSLDVVIPVKDEVDHIGACIQSVLAQDYPIRRVIVVNDRSTDQTAEVVDEIQRRHDRVERVDVDDLPHGQYGKPHALHVASSRYAADLLAFVDSDFQLAPNCLRTLVGQLRARSLDWLAVMGRPELSHFWERLLVPLLGAVTYAWYDPRKIADPKWPDAIGSGFLLVRRERYEQIGGHGAVAAAYDEDSEIMRVAKRAGHPIAYVLTPGLFTLRMYGSFQRTARGISRTFIGGLKTLPRFAVTIGALNFVSLVPFGLVALLVVLRWLGVPVPWEPGWWGWIALHLAAATALAQLIYAGAGGPRRYALLHPLGAAVLIGICIRAAGHLRRGRAIEWRGTSY
jgi:chlorobactene glucosyltransferase